MLISGIKRNENSSIQQIKIIKSKAQNDNNYQNKMIKLRLKSIILTLLLNVLYCSQGK